MRVGFRTFGEAFQAPSVDEEDVEPTVIVVIVEGDTAASGFEQVLVLVLAAVDGFDVEAGFFSYVDETESEVGGGFRRGRLGRGSGSLRACSRPVEDVLQRKYKSGAAQRLKETTPG